MKKDLCSMNIYIKVNNEVIEISNENGFKNIIDLVNSQKISQIEANKIFDLLKQSLKELGGISNE